MIPTMLESAYKFSPKPKEMSPFSKHRKKPKKDLVAPDGARAPLISEFYNVKTCLHPYIPKVIEKMLEIIFSESSDDKDKIRCIEQVLNRYDGKPVEKVEFKTSGDVESMSGKEIYGKIVSIIDALPNSSQKKHIITAAVKEAEIINAR